MQEDDFSTLEADEALITEDERREELLALEREGSLPLEELLKMYSSRRGRIAILIFSCLCQKPSVQEIVILCVQYINQHDK